jgi:hypothetical protein
MERERRTRLAPTAIGRHAPRRCIGVPDDELTAEITERLTDKGDDIGSMVT